MHNKTITITAIATAPGFGGVGIVRISGPEAFAIAHKFHTEEIKPRHAYFTNFTDQDGKIIDQGLLIYFKAPDSFTGEDVAELQGHGGPVVLDQLLKRVLELGATLARPGEFSERAFLNGKIDLVQAEAISDLINAVSDDAAKLAVRSLQGAFSKLINQFKEQLIQIRMQVEAAIDFSEEELNLDDLKKIDIALSELQQQIISIKESATQGELLTEGVSVAILGAPNVGKSSLLNLFTGEDSAIVTPIAGTTRDVLKAQVVLDGLPIKILDTAGLQETEDLVEKEGIRRALKALGEADHILYVCDVAQSHDETEDIVKSLKWLQNFLPQDEKLKERLTLIYNKSDLTNDKPHSAKQNGVNVIFMSAKTGEGFNFLKEHLKERFSFSKKSEGLFSARRRHLEALSESEHNIVDAKTELKNNNPQYELVAENLRLAQNHLSEITGEFVSDDLLSRIFSEFCIGK